MGRVWWGGYGGAGMVDRRRRFSGQRRRPRLMVARLMVAYCWWLADSDMITTRHQSVANAAMDNPADDQPGDRAIDNQP